MGRRAFRHLDQDWELISLGVGTGVATGFVPKADRWSVDFVNVRNPAGEKYRGYISEADPSTISADEVIRAFERARLVFELDRNIWKKASTLSASTGIPLDRVCSILDGSGDKVARWPINPVDPEYQLAY